MNRLRAVSRTGSKFTALIFFSAMAFGYFLFPSPLFSQDQETPSSPPALQALTLEQAEMCEDVSAQSPLNPAVVFSIKRQIVYCFSSFDPVPTKTVVYHNWFLNDKLSTKIKLRLQPPRWSTFSRIQLREADIGPWRVEIADEDGNILKILRFSVTD
jgi:hypothetical protein